MAHQASTATALKRKCPEPEAEDTVVIMCATGCGFHGSAATGNLCSKCYREHAAAAAAASDTTAGDSVFIAPAASTAPPEKKAKTIVSVASSDGAEPERKDTAGMCVNDCGFHGAAATGNMCSKCYKEHVASDTTTETSVFIAPAAASIAPPEKKAKTIVSVASSDGAVESSVKPPLAATNRCAACRKKVGLLGFRCRCEGTFCSAHRYSEKHDCGFDHKTAGKEKIAKLNPVVVADKMVTRI